MMEIISFRFSWLVNELEFVSVSNVDFCRQVRMMMMVLIFRMIPIYIMERLILDFVFWCFLMVIIWLILCCVGFVIYFATGYDHIIWCHLDCMDWFIDL